jgi:hypothetical protein
MTKFCDELGRVDDCIRARGFVIAHGRAIAAHRNPRASTSAVSQTGAATSPPPTCARCLARHGRRATLRARPILLLAMALPFVARFAVALTSGVRELASLGGDALIPRGDGRAPP